MSTGQFQPPSPLDPITLIDSADHAVNKAFLGGSSREVIHRVISTAYYAVCHAVNASNADVRPGVPTNAATAGAWTNTYRRMRHGFATRSLGHHMFYLTQDAQLLANHFISLKTARETADYDPNRSLTTGDANYWIRRSQGRPERPANHDRGRPSNLLQHYLDGKPVIS